MNYCPSACTLASCLGSNLQPINHCSISLPISQPIEASTNRTYDEEGHASPALSWHLPAQVKRSQLFQSCQWGHPKGVGLTRIRRIKEIVKEIG